MSQSHNPARNPSSFASCGRTRSSHTARNLARTCFPKDQPPVETTKRHQTTVSSTNKIWPHSKTSHNTARGSHNTTRGSHSTTDYRTHSTPQTATAIYGKPLCPATPRVLTHRLHSAAARGADRRGALLARRPARHGLLHRDTARCGTASTILAPSSSAFLLPPPTRPSPPPKPARVLCPPSPAATKEMTCRWIRQNCLSSLWCRTVLRLNTSMSVRPHSRTPPMMRQETSCGSGSSCRRHLRAPAAM